MLFKRGSTISAAEGGCQAEVGGTRVPFALRYSHVSSIYAVACSMASAGFAACMGGEGDAWTECVFFSDQHALSFPRDSASGCRNRNW